MSEKVNQDNVKPDEVKSESAEVVQALRTEEPKAPPGADAPNPSVVSDATHGEKGPGEAVEPGGAGYAGRDPGKDMPRMPSAPGSQGDPPVHDAEPEPGGGQDRHPNK